MHPDLADNAIKKHFSEFLLQSMRKNDLLLSDIVELGVMGEKQIRRYLSGDIEKLPKGRIPEKSYRELLKAVGSMSNEFEHYLDEIINNTTQEVQLQAPKFKSQAFIVAVLIAIAILIVVYVSPRLFFDQSHNKNVQTSVANPPLRAFLYGTWETNTFEMGHELFIRWTIKEDGTTTYIVHNDGQKKELNSKWTYGGGYIYEEAYGGTAKSKIESVSPNSFELTIIEGEQSMPESRQVKRLYQRVIETK